MHKQVQIIERNSNLLSAAKSPVSTRLQLFFTLSLQEQKKKKAEEFLISSLNPIYFIEHE